MTQRTAKGGEEDACSFSDADRFVGQSLVFFHTHTECVLYHTHSLFAPLIAPAFCLFLSNDLTQ